MNSKLVLACLVLVVVISCVVSAPSPSAGGNKLQSSNVKTNLKGGYGYGGYGGYGGYDYGYGGYDYCDPYYDPYCDYYDYGYGGYDYGYYKRR